MKNFNWRYVLRELIIVTAGILIAFTLNNWAQTQQQKQEEIRYLESLRTDLRADSSQMVAILENLTARQELAKSIVPHFYREIPGRDSIMLTIFSQLSGNFQNFVPHEATFQTLRSSGDLKLLRNFELKNQIVEHFNHYEALIQENERTNHYVKEIVSPYFMQEFPFSAPKAGTDRFLTDTRLQNIVFGWFGILQIQGQTYRKVLSQCTRLIAVIDRELGYSPKQNLPGE